MSDLTFSELSNQAQQLYNAEKYAKALEYPPDFEVVLARTLEHILQD